MLYPFLFILLALKISVFLSLFTFLSKSKEFEFILFFDAGHEFIELFYLLFSFIDFMFEFLKVLLELRLQVIIHLAPPLLLHALYL